MPETRIGCSGFSYKHWKEVFYPRGLTERKWLEFYSSVFSTVELNVTFYRLPASSSFQLWYRETPPGFLFAVKGSRYITHIKRLVDAAEPLEKYFEAASFLKDKLAVVLWQFPPSFKLNLDRLAAFMQLLKKYPFRHSFEFRNETWLAPSVVDLCREHNAALCMADSPEYINDLPLTSDFVYIRRHGHTPDHSGNYSKKQLEQDALRIRSYRKAGKDIFIYFNNDPHGYAPANARQLNELLS